MDTVDSPDVVIAKRLLDYAKQGGFVFQRMSSLIVSEDALVQRRVEGGALDVLNEVLTWDPQS